MTEKLFHIYGTSNKGKIEQVKEYLEYKKENIEIVSLIDIGFDEEIVEDGKTFEENSLIKAKAISTNGGNSEIFKTAYARRGADNQWRR